MEQTPDGPLVLNQGAHVAWARGWGVYSEVGYMARVVLRVTATEPPVMHLYVNRDPALQRVPDWIANRGKGTDPAADRATFNRVVLDAIRGAITADEEET